MPNPYIGSRFRSCEDTRNLKCLMSSSRGHRRSRVVAWHPLVGTFSETENAMAAWTVGAIHRRRMVVTVAVAALLVSASACGDDSKDSKSSTDTTSAQPTKELDSALADKIDAAIDKAVGEAGIPGAIVGIWGPDGQHIYTTGVSDKATKAPMEPDFYHRIGSVTKTFTVTGVLQLADEGKVGVDDPISKYIEGVPNGENITLRQLADMRSGLPSYSASDTFVKDLLTDPKRPFTPKELLDYAFAIPNMFAPGAEFFYCNTNLVLLGLVIEKVSGQKLPDYVKEHITKPLGMDHTIFPTDAAFPEPHAQGYTVQTLDGKEAIATDWNPSWGWAAGAMISTLEDLHIWAPALATGKLLKPEMQKERLKVVPIEGKPATDGYGMGIFNIGGWIGHNGSLPGYQTLSAYLPEKETTLIIELNTDEDYQGHEPSSVVATAITEVLSPDHVYTLGTPTTEPPK
jgi:D-alanyl-D-alanine carboxypeptidase